MFQWKKLGKIFSPREFNAPGWMNDYAQAPSAILLDKVVRVFFSSRPLPDAKGNYVSRLGYIDLNRDNLFDIVGICKTPVLPLGGLGTFDEFGTYPASVLKTGDEVRVYYAGWTRCESVPFNAAIGVARSFDDGETFIKLGEGPVLSYTPDEPFVLGSPKIRMYNNTWYLWYSSGKKWVPHSPKPEPVYKIRMAHSKDGIQWTKVGKDLLEDVLEDNECQASPDVFFYKGLYHMFFSYRNHLDFRNAGRGYRIGYASSKDLFHWTRADERAGITMSEKGWDSESVSYPHLFELDNNIYMFYQGNEIGKNGFGLAQLENYSN